MANWNADFSGFPKTTTKGQFFGSDKALKFPMKKMWEEAGEKVLNIKSFTVSKPDKNGAVFLVPRTLKERYEYIFWRRRYEKRQGYQSNIKKFIFGD